MDIAVSCAKVYRRFAFRSILTAGWIATLSFGLMRVGNLASLRRDEDPGGNWTCAVFAALMSGVLVWCFLREARSSFKGGLRLRPGSLEVENRSN